MTDILMNIGLVALGLTGLFFGGNWLVNSSSRIARALGVAPIIVGLTVVSFGTSAPEFMVSVRAALSGSSGIALGNVVGSNIANVGLILGITGLIAPIAVRISLVRREIPLMILITALVYGFMLDGELERFDGAFLAARVFIFNAGMLYFTINRSDEDKAADEAVDRSRFEGRERNQYAVAVGYFGGGYFGVARGRGANRARCNDYRAIAGRAGCRHWVNARRVRDIFTGVSRICDCCLERGE